MKRMATIILITALILITAGGTPYASIDTIVFSVEVKHIVQVRDGGLVVVYDTFSLTNNSTSPIATFPTGFSSTLWRNLDYLAVTGEPGRSVTLTKNITADGAGVYWVGVNLSPALEADKTYDFTIAYAFSGLVGPQGAYHMAVFPKYPALAIDAVSCRVSVTLPAGANVVDSVWRDDGKPVSDHMEKPFPSYSNEVGYLTFSGSFRILEVEWGKRVISLDPYGGLHFKDTYRIRNIGTSVIRSVDFQLPKGGTNVIAGDDIGSLDTSIATGKDANKVAVTFRYPLRGGQYRDAYNLTLEYGVKGSPYLSRTGLWEYRFNANITAALNVTIPKMDVEVALPEGGVYLTSSGIRGNVTSKGLQQAVRYSLTRVTPLHDVPLDVDYNYVIFWAAYRPVLWAGLVAFILGAVVIAHRRLRPAKPPTPPETIEAITSFVEVCEERTALGLELDSLDLNLYRGRISKAAYRQRRGAIEKRLGALGRDLTNLKRKLREAGPRYAEAVNRIEVAEAEIATMNEDLQRVEAQHRAGKLSREAVDRLAESYRKRIERARSAIDSILMGLREEVR